MVDMHREVISTRTKKQQQQQQKLQVVFWLSSWRCDDGEVRVRRGMATVLCVESAWWRTQDGISLVSVRLSIKTRGGRREEGGEHHKIRLLRNRS